MRACASTVQYVSKCTAGCTRVVSVCVRVARCRFCVGFCVHRMAGAWVCSAGFWIRLELSQRMDGGIGICRVYC